MTLLRATGGLIGWAVAFSLLYGLQGLVCSPRAAGWTDGLPLHGRELLVACWLLYLAALAGFSWRVGPCAASGASVAAWLAPVLGWVGTLSLAITGMPVVFATTCA